MKTIGGIKFDETKIEFGEETFNNIKEFFSKPEIIELVESNNWEKILDKGYNLPLADFLLKANINFLADSDKVFNQSFYYCESITSITIPDSVKEIGNEAFYQCPSLSSVTFPTSLERIGDDAFGYCKSLSSITLPVGLKIISKRAFIHCVSLSSVTFPVGLKKIGPHAFYDCALLSSVNLPVGLNTLDDGCFSFTSLKSITIPNTVKKIGKEVFYNDQSLSSITYKGTKVEWGKIKKMIGWYRNSGIKIIKCIDGDITL